MLGSSRAASADASGVAFPLAPPMWRSCWRLRCVVPVGAPLWRSFRRLWCGIPGGVSGVAFALFRRNDERRIQFWGRLSQISSSRRWRKSDASGARLVPNTVACAPAAAAYRYTIVCSNRLPIYIIKLCAATAYQYTICVLSEPRLEHVSTEKLPIYNCV